MMLDSLALQFKDSLEDLITKITINDDFSFSHQDYPSREIVPEMVTKLQKLPLDFQERYFASQLGNYLVDIYFRGCLSPINSEAQKNNLPLANNSIKGVDRDFYEQLKINNYSQGYFDPGWLVIAEENNGDLQVQKNGLTLQIKRDRLAEALPHRYLQKSDLQATVSDTVAIKLPHNRWQDEFYVAVSNNGLVEVNSQQQIIEIYFNINPEGAIILLRELTGQLNETNLIFTLKILDDPHDYPCYDAVILRIYQQDYLPVYQVIQNIYPHLISYLNKNIPIYTFKLADGIALAKVTEAGFSNSCCGAIAKGLLTAWNQGDNSPNNRWKCIQQELSFPEISWQE